jgi:hypothetical protein
LARWANVLWLHQTAILARLISDGRDSTLRAWSQCVTCDFAKSCAPISGLALCDEYLAGQLDALGSTAPSCIEMEALQFIREGLTLPDLAKGLVTVFVLVNFQRVYSPLNSPSRRRWQRIDYLSLAGFTFLFLFAKSWLALVTRYAPEPYLVRRGFQSMLLIRY